MAFDCPDTSSDSYPGEMGMMNWEGDDMGAEKHASFSMVRRCWWAPDVPANNFLHFQNVRIIIWSLFNAHFRNQTKPLSKCLPKLLSPQSRTCKCISWRNADPGQSWWWLLFCSEILSFWKGLKLLLNWEELEALRKGITSFRNTPKKVSYIQINQ